MMPSALSTRPAAKRWAWLLVALFTLMVVAGITMIERAHLGVRHRALGSDPVPVGVPAPNFHAPALWGGSVGLDQFHGEPVVLTFCSSWSPFCRAEAPTLAAAADRFQNRIVFLAVDVDESPDAALNFSLSAGIPYPVIPDPQGRLARLYGIRYLPTTVFIGRNGKVLEIFPGAFQNVATFERTAVPLFFPPKVAKGAKASHGN
jgi:thiol-disulfide isomerase/thioredoxin